MDVATNDNYDIRRKQVDISSVKQSDSLSTLSTYWEEPGQTNADITNYYDTPKYVVDV